MNKLSVHLYFWGTLAMLMEQLASCEAPQNVTFDLTVLEGKANLTCVPDELDVLVVVDSVDLVREATDKPWDNARLVYVGTEDELVAAFGTTPAQVVATWAGASPVAQAQARFERLLASLKQEFDAWLYQNWLMSLIDSLPDIVWYKERSGLHNLVNLQFCETVHKTREETRDQGHCFIWNAPPESEYQCAETDNAVMSSGHTVVADELVETDKGMRQFRTYKSPVRGRDGSIIGTVGLGHDVTDFTNMGMEMQILVDNLPYPVVLVDGKGKMAGANEDFKATFGFVDSDFVGMDYDAWRDTLATEAVEHIDAEGKLHSVHDYVADVDGTRRHYDLAEPTILDYFDNPSGHYGIFRDVTAERAYERQTLRLATTDALTGLANRHRFHHYLSDHAGQPMSLLNLDLDNFKLVNDTYGHARGDEVLEQVAGLLRELLPDGLVARLGGDEFTCALAGDRSDAELQDRAKLLRQRMHDDFESLGVGFGCSVGVVRTDHLPQDPDDFLREADKRMYRDKELHHAQR